VITCKYVDEPQIRRLKVDSTGYIFVSDCRPMLISIVLGVVSCEWSQKSRRIYKKGVTWVQDIQSSNLALNDQTWDFLLVTNGHYGYMPNSHFSSFGDVKVDKIALRAHRCVI